MVQILNFVVCNWWAMAIVVAIFFFPIILGLVLLGIALKMGFKDPKVKDLSFRNFWEAIRTKAGSSDSWWVRLLFHKYSRMTFLVSLFFVWGYILFIVSWGIGWLLGRVWDLVTAAADCVGNGIKRVYNKI